MMFKCLQYISINWCGWFTHRPFTHTVALNVKYSDTTEFTAPITEGIVVKVYDGDTITIAAKLPYANSPLYRFPVRLSGVNAPELRGGGISDNEKQAGKIVGDILRKRLMFHRVILKNIGTEKWGRILADVYVVDNNTHVLTNINEWLLLNKYAIVYDGRTKIFPDEMCKSIIRNHGVDKYVNHM